MKKIELYDAPPSYTTEANWEEVDEILLVLIDNPGKWAIVRTQATRTVATLQNRAGNGFTFRTRKTPDADTFDIWGTYHA